MKEETKARLGTAGTVLAFVVAQTSAHRLGFIGGDAVTRVAMGFIGLMVAWSGNRLPKVFVPSASASQTLRVGGWSLVLGGLTYTGLWAFAPMSVAQNVGSAAVAAAGAVTLACCLSLMVRPKTAGG